MLNANSLTKLLGKVYPGHLEFTPPLKTDTLSEITIENAYPLLPHTGKISAIKTSQTVHSTLLKKMVLFLLGKLNHMLLMLMLLTGNQFKILLCTRVNTFGLTLTNYLASTYTINNSMPGNKELASSPEDFLNLLLDTVLEVLPSLSSVELVEVSTPKLLMSVPILSVKSSRILKKMISPTQELLPITSVIT